jgi:hypothetical protein
MVKRFGPGASMIRQPWKVSNENPPSDLGPQAEQNQAANSNFVTETSDDFDMDALTSRLAATSLQLVPPSVARKQKKREQRGGP